MTQHVVAYQPFCAIGWGPRYTCPKNVGAFLVSGGQHDCSHHSYFGATYPRRPPRSPVFEASHGLSLLHVPAFGYGGLVHTAGTDSAAIPRPAVGQGHPVTLAEIEAEFIVACAAFDVVLEQLHAELDGD